MRKKKKIIYVTVSIYGHKYYYIADSNKFSIEYIVREIKNDLRFDRDNYMVFSNKRSFTTSDHYSIFPLYPGL